RMTGSTGAQETAKWLADYFQRAGYKSFAENYALPFQINAGERVLAEKTRLEISASEAKSPAVTKLDADFRPLAFSENGEVNSEVVFAGYGLVVPGEGAARYDSYAGLDVKDKVVLIFRYVPEGVDPTRPGALESLFRAALQDDAGTRARRERGARRDRAEFAERGPA